MIFFLVKIMKSPWPFLLFHVGVCLFVYVCRHAHVTMCLEVKGHVSGVGFLLSPGRVLGGWALSLGLPVGPLPAEPESLVWCERHNVDYSVCAPHQHPVSACIQGPSLGTPVQSNNCVARAFLAQEPSPRRLDKSPYLLLTRILWLKVQFSSMKPDQSQWEIQPWGQLVLMVSLREKSFLKEARLNVHCETEDENQRVRITPSR